MRRELMRSLDVSYVITNHVPSVRRINVTMRIYDSSSGALLSQKSVRGMSVSPLLNYRLKHGDFEFGKEYRSSILSEDYKSCPFAVVEFIKDGVKDRFMKLVFEGISKQVDIELPGGEVITKWTNPRIPKRYYQRYYPKSLEAVSAD